MRCVTGCPAVSSQPNLLHPMTSINWKRTSPLPFSSAGEIFRSCVVIGQEVFVVGWLLNERGWPVMVYHINSDYWAIHSWSLMHHAALTTYHSQLVLIGGEEIATGRATNTLLVWQNGEWCPSLPSMTVARRRAAAVSSGKHINVAGGVTNITSVSVCVWD